MSGMERAGIGSMPGETSRPAAKAPPPGAYGVLLLVLAGSLLANSVLGPLVLGVVRYPVSDTLANQLLGLELVTLVVVVPWAALAGVAGLMGARSAPLFGFAPSAYAAYMLVQYILGPEYDHYSVVVLGQLLTFVLAAGLMVWSWALSAYVPVPRRDSRDQRRAGLVMFALATFVALRYAGAVGGSFAGAGIGAEFAEERTFYWSIFLLDLGIVVPCTVAAGCALVSGAAGGWRAHYAVIGWFALVPPSVTAMAVVMLLRDDPHASVPTTLLLGAASVVFGSFAWHTFRTLLRPAGSLVPTGHVS